MGKNKFSLECFSGKIKHFKTIFSPFFLMENWVIEDPPSQLNGKVLFLKPSLTELVRGLLMGVKLLFS